MSHPTPPPVLGVNVDPQSRCAHWHSPLDIVALRFKCCGRYYACRQCHDETAGHPAQLWTPTDALEPAALCGHCGHTFTVADYFSPPTPHAQCPRCLAPWNPRCHLHRHLYYTPL